MKTNLFKISLIAIVCGWWASFFHAEASELYPFKYSSILSSGDWVKVRTSESGIYEITYDELIGMGFKNPQNVGVFGKGGTALPINFTDGKAPLITDDLAPVATWHHNNRIYFYACATEEIAFNPSSSLFERRSRNIYSLDGAYFLSESPEAMMISMNDKPLGNSSSYYLGFDYAYHEEDIFHNTTKTGQLFWGENLLTDSYSWQLSLPLIDNNAKARLECRVFAADKSSGIFQYGVRQATSGNISFNVRHPEPGSGSKSNPEFMHMANSISSLSIPGTEAEVYAKISNAKGDFINLDYWILTYGKIVPDFSLSNQPQERFTVVRKGTRPGVIPVESDKEIVAFDVTNPAAVGLLAKESEGKEINFYFDPSKSYRNLIFCDLSRSQKKVLGFKKIANSDLHFMASHGADFLIITVPKFMDFANRLADLHRKYDGIDVLVVSTEDVYNEFSGGIPDPMAYRAMMKATYEGSQERLKNLLLVGPEYGNFRNVLSGDDPENYIIAFQDNKVSADTDAAHAMDFMGFADDYIFTNLQNNTMHVGVGILPFSSLEESEMYLRKAERYLADTDKAAIVNEALSIGGSGDNHTHDAQSVSLKEFWDAYNPDLQVNAVVAIDAYGKKNSTEKIFSDLRYGKLLTAYCGHGSSLGLNNPITIRTTDVLRIQNSKPSFMIICACDISHPDRAMSGLGERIVTSTENGMVGSILASRTVWSGQNFELAKLISSSLFVDPAGAKTTGNGSQVAYYREETPTIGEVFARAKTISNYSNSLAYMYIGDPALRIPVPLRRIQGKTSLSGKGYPRQTIKVSGTIGVRDSIHLNDTIHIGEYILDKDTRYNGKIVAKLMAPKRVEKSKDLVSGASNNTKELYVTYLDDRLSEFSAEVKNGAFDFSITLPEDADIYAGESLQLMLSAYDPSRQLASAGYLLIPIGEGISGVGTDNSTPTLNAIISDKTPVITIKVGDNNSLGAACLRAEIDGKPVRAFLRDADADSKHLEFAIFTDNIEKGIHTLSLCASDAVGNKAEEEIEFEKADFSAPLSLIPEYKAAADELSFSIEGEDAESLLIIIENENHDLVIQSLVKGNSYLWNCSDSSSKRVKPGLYRAKVISSNDISTPLFSEWVNFAILEIPN